MDSPIRQYQKQKDYRRHKLFRKIKRRREAERQQAIDAPMKEMRRRVLRRFGKGKDTKWKALDNIEYQAIPDTTFTSDKTGAGDIEYFAAERPQGIRYNNGYYKPHPNPGKDIILYNPNTNDEQDIRLDALHIMPKDATYDVLNSLYRNEARHGDISYNAKLRYDEDAKKYGAENIDSYERYFENEADGFLRNMLIEGSPDYIKNKRYYPNKQDLRKWNYNVIPYVDAIQNYLKTGQRPANILEEVNVYAPKRNYAGGKDIKRFPEIEHDVDFISSRFDNPTYDAGTLPEVVIKPTNDTDIARLKMKQMVPNKELRQRILMNDYPVRFTHNGRNEQLADNVPAKYDFNSNEYDRINRYYNIWNQSGRPSIKYKGDFFDPIVQLEIGSRANINSLTSYRDHYNALFNSIHLNKQIPGFLSELSHAYQHRNKENPLYRKSFFNLPGDIKIAGKSGYDRLGHFENDAHSVIEPALFQYVNGNLSTLDDVNNLIKDINEHPEFYQPDAIKIGWGFDKGKDSGIHINPKNRGKFNALKKRTGKTTEQLTHSKNPLTRKRAIFAQNAKKWHHK